MVRSDLSGSVESNRFERDMLIQFAGDDWPRHRIHVRILQHETTSHRYNTGVINALTIEHLIFVRGSITAQDGRFELKLPPINTSGWLGVRTIPIGFRGGSISASTTRPNRRNDGIGRRQPKSAGRVPSRDGKTIQVFVLQAQAAVPDMDTRVLV